VELQLARTGELVEFLLQGFADAGDALQIVGCSHGHDFPLEITHYFRAIAVGPCLERVLALDFHEQCDLIEHRGDFIT